MEDRLDKIRAIRQGKIKEYCEWKYVSEDDDYYETTCSQAFYLTNGTPKDNHYKFCPHCGRRIKETENDNTRNDWPTRKS